MTEVKVKRCLAGGPKFGQDHMGVSEYGGFFPQIIHGLIGFSIINHPFWGTTIFGNTHIYIYIYINIHAHPKSTSLHLFFIVCPLHLARSIKICCWHGSKDWIARRRFGEA